MQDSYEIADFTPHVGTAFTVELAGHNPVTLTLATVDELPEQPSTPRTKPFSLWFTAAPDVAFPQGIVAVDHPVLGRVELFLVPRQPEADGLSRYEAVFN